MDSVENFHFNLLETFNLSLYISFGVKLCLKMGKNRNLVCYSINASVWKCWGKNIQFAIIFFCAFSHNWKYVQKQILSGKKIDVYTKTLHHRGLIYICAYLNGCFTHLTQNLIISFNIKNEKKNNKRNLQIKILSQTRLG